MLARDETAYSPVTDRTQVLVVDDEPIIVRRLKTLLDDLGYEVTACTDSEQALAIINQQDFEIIITDLRMKKHDGFSILERARQRNSNTRVIVMTGLGSLQHRLEALNRGAAGCIGKPFRIEELRDAINRNSRCAPGAGA